MKKILKLISCFLFIFCAFLQAEEGGGEKKEDPSFWGYHLILDCTGCDIEKIDDREALLVFVKDLVEEIEMKAYGEPILEYFAEHIPAAAGYSLVQLIETSAITGHFASINGDSYIDIFSCKFFDVEKAKKVVEKHLGPKKIRATFLYRQA